MKTIFTIVLAIACILISYASVSAQGCVAVRHMSSVAPVGSADYFKQRTGHWQVSAGYRFFRSYKHFVGDAEQKQRVEQGTNVINVSHAIDLGITYMVNQRLSFSVNLPLQNNGRSSLYEHYGNAVAQNPEQKRFHTGSQGVGDLRISGSYWLVNPVKLPKANLAVGLGVKLPTGNYRATDQFHKLDKEGKDYTVELPVDQSIQLGDGGVGVSVELQGYAQLSKGLALYANGFYLFNPRETNGVVRNPLSTTVDPVTGTFSVADQFAARVGLSQSISAVPGLAVMLGGRVEGVPAMDAFGGSQGFRRPGYIVSVEPGLAYMRHKTSIAATVPIALYRNRIKSYSDRLDPAGLRQGDAAFADYLVSINVSRWF
ncbi:hypothetical protein [Spirosoma endophyticum]|uniref:MetA-pathway of phenol degradation n=1 Tax=Spirosoma endophyticum TaxID=662367 RepID=A0A1I1QXP1_9BACT|nr:hypothetical protein [Spirosoma endophyticum]SFD26859.1 hypothetical protein SAMN05216167_104164 [Spirosoma endophyticum]